MMRRLPLRLCLLTLVVLFSQCSRFHFTDRKYTRGRYHDRSTDLSVKKKPSKSLELPDITVKTDLSVDVKEPVEKQEEEGSSVTADKNKLTDVTTKESAKALPKVETKTKATTRISKRALQLASKLPFSHILINTPQKKSEARASTDNHLPSTILSIVGFALGIIALVLSFFSIIASIIISGVSSLFYVAIALGLLAIACGIVALILGHGDLERYEKTFSVLAISLGGAAVIIALIFSSLIGLLVGN